MARAGGKDRGLYLKDPTADPKGPNWWIQFTDANGKKRREKGGTKAQARDLYTKRKAQILTGQKLPETLNRRALTIKDLVTRYEPEMTAGKPEKAASNFVRHGEQFSAAFGDVAVNELRPGDVEAWKAKRLNQAEPATVNRALAYLKRLFNLARRDGLTESNPLAANRVRMLQESNQRERFITPEEEVLLREALPRPFWLAVLIGLQTGLRQGEQLVRTREEVDLRRKILVIPSAKGGGRQHVMLNAVAVAALKELLASHDSPYVFPASLCARGKTSEPLSSSSATHKLQRVCNKLELKDITWHTLRHTYISRLCMLGVPLPTVQKLARHKSIQMTLRYSHLCPNHERESVELLGTSYPDA